VRNDCWSRKSRPEKGNSGYQKLKQKKPSHGNNRNIYSKENRKEIKNSDSQSSADEDNEEANVKKTCTAAEYRVCTF